MKKLDMCEQCDICDKKAVYNIEKNVIVTEIETGMELKNIPCEDYQKLCTTCFKQLNL